MFIARHLTEGDVLLLFLAEFCRIGFRMEEKIGLENN